MNETDEPALARTRAWLRRHIPPGLRFVLGLILIVGGVFGFLPVLGFWMIPLGIMLAALDVVALWRWLRARRGNDRAPPPTP